MSKRTSLLQQFWAVAAFGTVFASLPQVVVNAATINFYDNLSGANEVPPNSSSGTGTATGTLTAHPTGVINN